MSFQLRLRVIRYILYIFHNCIYVTESINTLLRMQASSNLTLTDIKKRLSNIKNMLKNKITVPEDDNVIAQMVPLISITMIKELESLLKESDDAVTQFVSKNKCLCHIYKRIDKW